MPTCSSVPTMACRPPPAVGRRSAGRPAPASSVKKLQPQRVAAPRRSCSRRSATSGTSSADADGRDDDAGQPVLGGQRPALLAHDEPVRSRGTSAYQQTKKPRPPAERREPLVDQPRRGRTPTTPRRRASTDVGRLPKRRGRGCAARPAAARCVGSAAARSGESSVDGHVRSPSPRRSASGDDDHRGDRVDDQGDDEEREAGGHERADRRTSFDSENRSAMSDAIELPPRLEDVRERPGRRSAR